jgi:hypothetical protein
MILKLIFRIINQIILSLDQIQNIQIIYLYIFNERLEVETADLE